MLPFTHRMVKTHIGDFMRLCRLPIYVPGILLNQSTGVLFAGSLDVGCKGLPEYDTGCVLKHPNEQASPSELGGIDF